MKSIKISKGFTLLEVVIAIAIFAFLIISFLSAFSFSIDNIFSSGKESKATYKAQQGMEYRIMNNDEPITGIENVYSAEDKTNVTVTIEFPALDVVSKGKVINATYQDSDNIVDLYTYIPD